MSRILVSYSFRRNAILLGENIARALEGLGHEVVRYDSHADHRWMTGIRLIKSLAKLVNAKACVAAYFERREDRRQAEAFLVRVATERPDVVVVIRGDRIPVEAIDACPQYGVRHRVVWWVKHPRWQHLLLDEAPHYDAAFSIDGTLSRLGVQPLPSWALQSETFFADRRSKSVPLLFVGAWSERRERFLAALADLPLTVIGPGWSKRLPRDSALRARLVAPWVSGDRLGELYRSALIVVDINQIEQRQNQGTNMRLADVPACGTLLLTEPSDEIGAWFEDGRHISIYASIAELRKKAVDYLRNPAEAEAMGRAAAQQAQALPTFFHRAHALLGEVPSAPGVIFQAAAHAFDASSQPFPPVLQHGPEP